MTLLNQIIYLALLLTVVACDQPYSERDNDTEDRAQVRQILEGWETGNDNFKMVGSLISTTELSPLKDFGLCTGTIVGKNLILTASHCLFDNNSPKPLNQLFFTNRDNVLEARPFQFKEILSVRVLPGRDDKRFDSPDLALVRVKARFSTDFPLISPEAIRPSEAPFLAVGYGFSDTVPLFKIPNSPLIDEGLGVRRYGALKVTAVRDQLNSDNTRQPKGTLVTESFFGNHITCAGDSGGPLLNVVDNQVRLVGVSSWKRWQQENQCENVSQSGYQAVAPHSAWITQMSTELTAKGACRKQDDSEFVTAKGGCQKVSLGVVFSEELDKKLKFDAAKKHCDELEEGGKSDWRLPTRSELRSVVAQATDYLALSPETVGYQFWTDLYPYRVHLGAGGKGGNLLTDAPNLPRHVICVRK